MIKAMHIAKMEHSVGKKVNESAWHDFIRLWVAPPVLVFSYVVFWFAAISDPRDQGIWEFTSEHVREEMPTLSHLPVWLAIPMYLCLFLLPYTAVGATASLLRAACIVHTEHAKTIMEVICENDDRSVDSALNEFRCLAEALAWSAGGKSSRGSRRGLNTPTAGCVDGTWLRF